MTDNNQALSDLLRKHINKTQLQVSSKQIVQLVEFVNLLHKWNKAYNLTSVRDPKEMVVKHIMDSIIVAPHLTEQQY
ncbi:MAG: 16S rRNA (guanine527-N7)-methyltransferase, partial [Paraglaciecola sp.]